MKEQRLILAQTSTLKGVIFDFNGTLVKDTHLHNHAWDILLKGRNRWLSDQQKVQFLHGKSNRESFEYLFPGQHTDTDIAQMAEEKESMYRKLFLETKTQLVEGAESLFRFLKERSIPFVIATSSGQPNVDFFVETLRLDRYFSTEAILFNDGTIAGKPDPQIFILAMISMRVKPQETLIFEDSPSGIAGAHNAGAGRIVIVDTNNNGFQEWNYPVIRDFTEFDRNLLQQ